MKRILFALALLVAFVFLVSYGQAAVIYSQPEIASAGTVGVGPGLVSTYTSDTDVTTGAGGPTGDRREDFRVYDNFVIPSDFTLNDVHWTGAYDRVGSATTATAFEIGVWADAGGEPSTAGPLAFYSIPIGSITETPDGTTATEGFPKFQYSTDLPVPFIGSGGTTYWLSIVGESVAPTDDDGLWLWHFGTGGSAGLWQDTDLPAGFLPPGFNPGNDNGVIEPGVDGRNGPGNVPDWFPANDVAFQLTGELAEPVIPEPASAAVWLLTAAATGFSLVVRRRRWS